MNKQNNQQTEQSKATKIPQTGTEMKDKRLKTKQRNRKGGKYHIHHRKYKKQQERFNKKSWMKQQGVTF